MNDADTLSLSKMGEDKTSNEFKGRLTDTQINLFILWQENIRQPDQIIKTYNERWPDDKLSDSTLIKELLKLKKATLTFHRESMRDQLLFEYEILFGQANQAWLDSKADIVVITEEHGETPKGTIEKHSEKRIPQVGDPRHWRNALEVLNQIRVMTGVDQPKRIETIMRKEIDLILQFFETVLTPAAFDEVMKALVQYENEKSSLE